MIYNECVITNLNLSNLNLDVSEKNQKVRLGTLGDLSFIYSPSSEING